MNFNDASIISAEKAYCGADDRIQSAAHHSCSWLVADGLQVYPTRSTLSSVRLQPKSLLMQGLLLTHISSCSTRVYDRVPLALAPSESCRRWGESWLGSLDRRSCVSSALRWTWNGDQLEALWSKSSLHWNWTLPYRARVSYVSWRHDSVVDIQRLLSAALRQKRCALS